MILLQVKSSGPQVSQSIVSNTGKSLDLKPLSSTGDITPTYDTHRKSKTFSINLLSLACNSLRNLPCPRWHSDFNKFKTFRVLPAYQTNSWNVYFPTWAVPASHSSQATFPPPMQWLFVKFMVWGKMAILGGPSRKFIVIWKFFESFWTSVVSPPQTNVTIHDETL